MLPPSIGPTLVDGPAVAVKFTGAPDRGLTGSGKCIDGMLAI